MKSASDINTAALLLVVLLAALCAWRPHEAYRTLAGVADGAVRTARTATRLL